MPHKTREERLAYIKAYDLRRKNDPVRRAERVKATRRYAQRHVEGWNNYQHKYHRSVRFECIAHYGGQCVCCGEAEKMFLCLDHINNDGATDRKIIGASGSTFFLRIRRAGYPSNLQVLCFNCNNAKRITGSCPHGNLPQ